MNLWHKLMGTGMDAENIYPTTEQMKAIVNAEFDHGSGPLGLGGPNLNLNLREFGT